jgi:hypothetical protein
MWTLRALMDSVGSNSVEINGRWVPARPINWRYRTLRQRISEAWLVFTGRADAFTWPEGQ